MSPGHPCVFVVDDDVSVRESLKNLFRSVGLKVDTFPTAEDFLSNRRPSDYGCLVLDVRMPGLSGLDLQTELDRLERPIAIVFITGHGDIPMSVRAIKGGAVEFLTKPFRDQDLLDAVRKAMQLDQERQRREAETVEIRERYGSLTPREQEVLKLVVAGLANKQIAADMGISEPTVKLHRGRIMRKMGADSLAALIRMALVTSSFAKQ